MSSSRDKTLVVIAQYDGTFAQNVADLCWQAEGAGHNTFVADTTVGGHPSKAFIDAYRFDQMRHTSYLFLQDSLVPEVDDYVAPFREKAQKQPNGQTPEVVAWGFFPMFFDSGEQAHRVRRQYPNLPPVGIFGPIFYAERKALEFLDKFNLFPWTPVTKMDAQGTERAWAAAFWNASIPMTALGPVVNDGESPRLFPEDKTFTKVFGDRQ